MNSREPNATAPILSAPTITCLPETAAGAVIVSGSHGGLYPGYCAAKGGLRAVIFHDAGVGKEAAGIASLNYLQARSIAAATVSSNTCRIGDAEDMLARGTISHANALAESLGVSIGMACRDAALRLRLAKWNPSTTEAMGEARTEVTLYAATRKILLLDSASLVRPSDDGHIIVTGSHGGLVGGDPDMALRANGFAAVYHDAGGGIEGAGFTRLPALDQRGIAAFTVAASSARIGEARSVYEDGKISAVNKRAQTLGAQVGDRAKQVLQRWASL